MHRRSDSVGFYLLDVRWTLPAAAMRAIPAGVVVVILRWARRVLPPCPAPSLTFCHKDAHCVRIYTCLLLFSPHDSCILRCEPKKDDFKRVGGDGKGDNVDFNEFMEIMMNKVRPGNMLWSGVEAWAFVIIINSSFFGLFSHCL